MIGNPTNAGGTADQSLVRPDELEYWRKVKENIGKIQRKHIDPVHQLFERNFTFTVAFLRNK